MAAGFIYVLVNSSMPGILKVGKTTRAVAERCAELTAATGVPTPFVVAFEQYFDDCDAAEQAIHAELARAGLRQANNREFFRSSANEVIRLILATPGTSAVTREDPGGNSEPWAGLFAEAQSMEEREGNLFGDNEEAKRMYLAAAQLGAPLGYQMAANIALLKKSSDYREVIAIYKKGVGHGDYGCYAGLAMVLEERGQRWDARAAWEKHLEGWAERKDGRYEGPVGFEQRCVNYICLCLKLGVTPNIPAEAVRDPQTRRDIYDEALEWAVGPWLDEAGQFADLEWLKVVEWIEACMLAPGDERVARRRAGQSAAAGISPIGWLKGLLT